MTAPLRVLLVLDDGAVPAAVARTVDRVAAAPAGLVEVVGVRRLRPPRRTPSLATVAERVDRRVFRPRPDATAPVDLRALRLPLLADGADPGPLDIVLDLTTAGAPDPDLPSARLGTWSLRYGGDHRRLGPDAFVPEYLAGADAAVCELVVERDGAGRRGQRVAYRSVGAVDHLSPARTRNAAAWKAAEIPARVLREVGRGGAGGLPLPTTASAPPPPPPPATFSSRRTRPARVLATVAGRSTREAARRVGRRPAWFVAVRTGSPERPGDPGFGTAGFRPLPAPAGRFFADPFVVARPDGGADVLVEDGALSGGPARLSVLSLDAQGRPDAPPRVVLECPWHLSYPHVFTHADDRYLLPEAAGSGSVRLYRARDYPWTWEVCADLLPGVPAWDPTLVHRDGRFWLFVTLAAPGVRPSDELHLFSAPALDGPYLPHPANPVVSDVRRARPAGRVLERAGCLLRPAQDGSGAYGRRIVLNRVDVLTEDEYVERPVAAIEPGWLPGVERTHTYNADGAFEVVDGLRYVARFGSPA